MEHVIGNAKRIEHVIEHDHVIGHAKVFQLFPICNTLLVSCVGDKRETMDNTYAQAHMLPCTMSKNHIAALATCEERLHALLTESWPWSSWSLIIIPWA